MAIGDVSDKKAEEGLDAGRPPQAIPERRGRVNAAGFHAVGRGDRRRGCAHENLLSKLKVDGFRRVIAKRSDSTIALLLPDDRYCCRVLERAQLDKGIGWAFVSVVACQACRFMQHYANGSSLPRMVGRYSATVGWICMARWITVYVAFAYITSSKTWMTSSPPVPRMAAPSICLVSASTQIFMNPWVSPFSYARLTRIMGDLVNSARRPDFRISASVMPQRPSGGSMYRA